MPHSHPVNKIAKLVFFHSVLVQFRWKIRRTYYSRPAPDDAEPTPESDSPQARIRIPHKVRCLMVHRRRIPRNGYVVGRLKIIQITLWVFVAKLLDLLFQLLLKQNYLVCQYYPRSSNPV